METFYIHDKSRGCVGNSAVWWRKDHRGYTCDVREAHVFNEDELAKYLQSDDLVAFPCEYINQRISHHVDIQYIRWPSTSQGGK